MIDYTKFPNNNILCVDMRSFYASCEAVYRGLDPNKCYLAVVGNTDFGSSIVLAASPMLKKDFNIRTGNRLFDIPKDPKIHIVNARMKYYLQKSMEIFSVLSRYIPLENLHVYSIDEAWVNLDITNLTSNKKWEFANKIKLKLLNDFGLSCAIGIGPNMFMSKVCLDNDAKKHGIAEWTYKDIPTKLWPLPVRKCWGIGNKLGVRLNNLGIKTLEDLAHYPLDLLEYKFGIIGNQLYYHAWGIDLSELGSHYYHTPKSIGKGTTLKRDYYDSDEIKTVILQLCEDICKKARKKKLAGKTVHLSLYYSAKQGGGKLSHSVTMNHISNLTMDIYKTCMQIFNIYHNKKAVRKISISLTNLTTDNEIQLNFFSPLLKEKRLAIAMDTIRDRYGYNAILRASSYKHGSIASEMKNKIGGHKA